MIDTIIVHLWPMRRSGKPLFELTTPTRPQLSPRGRLVTRKAAIPAMIELAGFTPRGAEQALDLAESHRGALSIRAADFS